METQIIADGIGYVAAVIGTVMFLPQVIQCWKTKETKDISFLSYSLLVTSAVLWVSYGLLMHAFPIIFVNTIIGILSIFLLMLKRRYG